MVFSNVSLETVCVPTLHLVLLASVSKAMGTLSVSYRPFQAGFGVTPVAGRTVNLVSVCYVASWLCFTSGG